VKIRFGYELVYNVPQLTPMIFALHCQPQGSQQLKLRDIICTEPAIPLFFYPDVFGNTCTRLEAPAGLLRVTADGIMQDCGLPEPALWVNREITFGYQFARPTKTALETFQERRGVCRDLAHLAIAFCRCLNIPARYCTTYLGDIGVPAVDAPMDFAGCMEVFLGGAWHVFDPRNNARRIGRIIIARGRDAGDVAISTAFGAAWLQTFRVWTDEASDVAATQPLTSTAQRAPAHSGSGRQRSLHVM
jgi:hypothetical protein